MGRHWQVGVNQARQRNQIQSRRRLYSRVACHSQHIAVSLCLAYTVHRTLGVLGEDTRVYARGVRIDAQFDHTWSLAVARHEFVAHVLSRAHTHTLPHYCTQTIELKQVPMAMIDVRPGDTVGMLVLFNCLRLRLWVCRDCTSDTACLECPCHILSMHSAHHRDRCTWLGWLDIRILHTEQRDSIVCVFGDLGLAAISGE